MFTRGHALHDEPRVVPLPQGLCARWLAWLQLRCVRPLLLPRLKPFLFFPLLRCYFWCMRDCVAQRSSLPRGPYAEQAVALCRSPAKASLLLPQSHVSPVLREGEVVTRPRQALCAQLGLPAAHLLGPRSTRFSQTAEVCAINEQL